MNHTVAAGRLGADPEVRFTSSGQKITTFRFATKCRRNSAKRRRSSDEVVKDDEVMKDDERDDEVIWWRVSVWGDQFDRMIPYLKKGSSIIVMGEMSKPEIYTDRDGKSKISMNLTAYNLSFSPFGRSDSGPPKTGASSSANGVGHLEGSGEHMGMSGALYGEGKGSSFLDEEIPF